MTRQAKTWREKLIAQTEKVIRASIAHWKRMRKKRARDYVTWTTEEPYDDDCPLCASFGGCQFCALRLSGLPSGCGAVYITARHAWEDIEAILSFSGKPTAKALTKWHKAADAMIALLEGLLE